MKIKIRYTIKEFVNNWELAGLSVGIIKSNNLYFKESFGIADQKTKSKLTTKSVFNTGSLAKQVIVFALMQLHEKKLIDINDKLSNYLPEFELDKFDYSKITIKQIITHTSGLPDNDSDYDYHKEKFTQETQINYSLKNAIQDFVDKKSELISKPGTEFHYSNLGYNILGELISRVSGLNFEDYIKQNIFDPLQMDFSSFFSIPDYVSAENITIGHVRASKLTPLNYYAYQRSNAPCSALNSNIDDILKWVQLNLNNGVINDTRHLKSESYENFIYKPCIHFSDKGFWKDAGFSWFLGEYEGQKSIISLGGNDGYNSSIVMFPELSLAVSVLSNTEYAPIYAITTSIIDILLGKEKNEARKLPAYLPLGSFISEMGLGKGIEKFDEIMKANPLKYDCSDGSIDVLADHLMMMNKLEKALSVAKYNFKLFPDSETTIIRIGLVYELQGKIKEATTYFDKALKINPNNSTLKRHSKDLVV